MFRITADVLIGDFKPVKPNALSASRSVNNFTDFAKVKLPAVSMLKSTQTDTYEKVQTGLQFKEGMKVEIQCGYDGKNPTVFKGFLSRINFSVPLEIECEGYSYQLRKKIDFTKSYRNTTVKTILTDLVKDTDIKLSKAIPNIPIEKAVFENCTGVNVLEWLKNKCLLTVYFNFDTLYVGLMQLDAKGNSKLRLGWNVIKDNELKFNNNKEFAEVRIELSGRKRDGRRNKGFAGKKDGQVKRLKTFIKDEDALNKIAQQKHKELLNRGYVGNIICFLVPYIEPGMSIEIEDLKYPERTGKYFVEDVDYEITPTGGGRQKIKLGSSL